MHFASSITRIRVRMVAFALGLALIAVVVAACGSSNDNTTSGGAAASTSTPAKSTSTAAAPANKSSAGVTDYVKYVGGTAGAADSSKSPIVIGYVNQQGGANDVGPNSTIGAQLAADYVNKYAGGIDGHPVKLHTCFISTSEEQGQQCGQKMANDKAVDAVGVGAVAVGAQPLNASIAGEKPMFWGVSVNQVDTKNKNGFILFGDSFHILAPWGTFGRDVPVWLHREWSEADVRITTGFVEPHFFAGFSGGPKLVAPGLAALETVLVLHDAARIGDPRATWGITHGNPVHDDVRTIAEATGVTFALYENLSPGYGYTAIAVALIAGLNPLGIIGSGIFFGILETGATALQREFGVPSSLASVVEATLVLAVLGIAATRGRRLFGFRVVQ